MEVIYKAIAEVRKKAGTLSKESFNPHGRYNYVPIDAYYQKIVPIASEAGLIWRCRETDWDFNTFNIKGEEKTYVRAAYTFDVYLDAAVIQDYFKVTVCSPFTGPQTAGQMFSYADKVFMRVAFAVATGESDGDDIAPEDAVRGTAPRRPPPQPIPDHDPVTGEIKAAAAPVVLRPTLVPDVRPSETKTGDPIIDTRPIVDEPGVQTAVAIFKTWLPKITTNPQLHDWYAENLAAIEKIGKVNPAAQTEIKALFRERNDQLKK